MKPWVIILIIWAVMLAVALFINWGIHKNNPEDEDETQSS